MAILRLVLAFRGFRYVAFPGTRQGPGKQQTVFGHGQAKRASRTFGLRGKDGAFFLKDSFDIHFKRDLASDAFRLAWSDR